MRRKTKASNGFSTILSSIVVALIMCLLVSFVYKRTDEFTTGFKSFYVEYGDNMFVNEENNMSMKVGETYKFKVRSTIDEISDGQRNYKVSVEANPNETYPFFPCNDDGTCDMKSLKDVNLNNYFTFTYGDDYFTISDTSNLYTYIETLYADYDFVDFKESYVYGETPYFRLVITSLKDVETINIDFNLTR